jgi:hypothetical protein
MKKVIAIAAVGVFALGLTSCKKEYTCKCTVLGQTVEGKSDGKLKKKDAEEWCDKSDTAAKAAGGSCSLES